MKTNKIMLLTFFILFTTTNCKGDVFCRSELSEAQSQLIPYEKGQVYQFINNEGESIELTVTESKTEPYEMSVGSGNDYALMQVKTAVLKSSSNDLEIEIKIFSNDCARQLNYTRLIVSINNGRDFALRTDSDGNFLDDPFISFYENMEINNDIYYNVVEQSYNEGIDGGLKSIIQLFYNKTYGILQINRGGNNFLTLIPESIKGNASIQKAPAENPEKSKIPAQSDGKDREGELKKLEQASALAVPTVDIAVFPNPNDGNFTVEIKGETTASVLEIYNHAGVLVDSVNSNINTVSINRTNLHKGTYFVKLTLNGKSAVKKIVIQ